MRNVASKAIQKEYRAIWDTRIKHNYQNLPKKALILVNPIAEMAHLSQNESNLTDFKSKCA